MAEDERDDPPLTVDSLADLQAGLHDDNAAARLRRKVRTDPEARQTMDALSRVRGDISALSSDGVVGTRGRPRDRQPDWVRAARAACRPPGRPPRLGAARGRADRVDRGRRRRLAGNPGADHRARGDDEPAHHHRTHHRLAPAAIHSAVGSADPRPGRPRAGFRPADRSASPRVMPVRSGLSDERPRAGRPADRHRRASGRSSGAARRRARRRQSTCGGADLQCSQHRPVG